MSFLGRVNKCDFHIPRAIFKIVWMRVGAGSLRNDMLAIFVLKISLVGDTSIAGSTQVEVVVLRW